MKKLILRLMALTVFIWVAGSAAGAAEMTNVSVISGPFGTGSYVLSSALEELSKSQHPWLRINASETPGLVFNTKKLNREPELKKNMFMSYTVGINFLATKGLKPFKKIYPSAMLLANYNLGAVWLASLDAKIQNKNDLDGKKIALGRGTQILWAIEPDLLIRHGWGMENKIKVQYVGTKPAARALLDGLVDAGIVGGYADPIRGQLKASPQTIELLASGKKLYHVSWGQDAVQKVIDKGIPIAHLKLEANTIEGQDKPLEVFCDPIAWCAYPEFDEKLAYEVAKMIIEQVDKFKDYHALGKLMSPKSLVYGWDETRIHPGALKAYKEAGVIK
jgi:TRAP transporter TAXI family solute receptor